MRTLVLVLALVSPPWAVAQTTPTPVPGKHIPPTVLMELRSLENQFDLALSRDCAPERCTSKGCIYQEHVVVDLPRNGSLPGLGQQEGPGSVPPQEYLTQAHCDFAHEKSVGTRDVQALVKRLEQRLSKGFLQVSVGHQLLEPISESLRESPKPPEPPKVEAPATPAAPPPAKWEADVALRELWVTLLPHFFWMLGILLASLATLAVIWGLRRVGKASIEEKAILAQLEAGTPGQAPASTEKPALLLPSSVEALAQTAFVSEQQQRWTDRIAQVDLARDESVVVEFLREWLKAGEFALLAKAIFLFGDRLSVAFPSDGEFAVRKAEFAEYLKHLKPEALPSDADFFHTLNQHAVSSSVLSQSDTNTYLSLREEFGSNGVATLIQSLPARYGALLFGMVPPDGQEEVARLLVPELRWVVASQLLVSNRISREERTYLFEALDAARAGLTVPPPPKAADDLVDRGRAFDAAGALSVLLPHIEATERPALFTDALERSNGVFPLWYEDILYPEMLLKLPNELRGDLLLAVDIKGLAGWSSVQNAQWRQSFLSQLAPSMQNALKANLTFRSRAEQLRLAQRGRDELVASVKRLLARGTVSFSQMVA